MSLYIYPSDIQKISRRSERYAQKLIRAIKDALGKLPHQLVTIYEYAEYMGIPPDLVRQHLDEKR